MLRKPHLWKLKNRELQLGDRTLLAGVLDVAPDGKHVDPDRAFARALELEEQGANVIDLIAQPATPGSLQLSEADELRRLVPVLKRLRDTLTIPIAVTTSKSAVAERALELGVEIISDPTGLTFDPQLPKTVAAHDAALIVTHMRGTPETWAKLAPLPDVMAAILHDLEASLNRARRAGIERARMAVDPGLGFGKRKEENSRILARLGQMEGLGLPVVVGPFQDTFGPPLATAAAVTASILGGAALLRVLDVEGAAAAAQIADAISRAAAD